MHIIWVRVYTYIYKVVFWTYTYTQYIHTIYTKTHYTHTHIRHIHILYTHTHHIHTLHTYTHYTHIIWVRVYTYTYTVVFSAYTHSAYVKDVGVRGLRPCALTFIFFFLNNIFSKQKNHSWFWAFSAKAAGFVGNGSARRSSCCVGFFFSRQLC